MEDPIKAGRKKTCVIKQELVRKQCYFTKNKTILLIKYSCLSGLNESEIVRNAINNYLGDNMFDKLNVEKTLEKKKLEKEKLELEIKSLEIDSKLEKINTPIKENVINKKWLND